MIQPLIYEDRQKFEKEYSFLQLRLEKLEKTAVPPKTREGKTHDEVSSKN